MRNHGFTLIELLFVLAITGAVLTLSVQTFGQSSKQRLISQSLGTWVKTLRFARATAIGSNREITVCPSANGMACTDHGYERGWIVFAEHDGETPGQIDAGEPVLAMGEALDARLTLRANTAFTTRITFRANGRAHGNGRFVICADGNSADADGIFVNYTGRLRSAAAGELTQCLNA